MNKGIIIGIAIAIIIGIGAIMVSGNSSDLNDQDLLGEKIDEVALGEQNEPKQFSVGLSENVGFTENKP